MTTTITNNPMTKRTPAAVGVVGKGMIIGANREEDTTQT